MGGYGSGRSAEHATVEGSCWIAIEQWRRQDVLKPGGLLTCRWARSGRETGSIGAWLIAEDGGQRVSAAVLTYQASSGGSARDVRETVPVEWAPCRYGGARPYYVCPPAHGGCGERVLRLYLGRGALFLCRRCCGLTYTSRRESWGDRALRQAQAIRQQLGGSASMVEPFPEKPAGMHRRTYRRLYAKAEAAELLADDWFIVQVQELERRRR